VSQLTASGERDSRSGTAVERKDLTSLINAWQKGDDRALDALMPHIYEELHRLAARQMRQESAGHTLQATALVNEAFMRLAHMQLDYKDRKHFLAMAARTMRRVLVDHARQKKSAKRGGDARNLPLDEQVVAADADGPDVIELDMALTRLAGVDQGLATVVELVFFGGLTYAEAATALGVSKTRLFDDLKLAKAWLKADMSDGAADT
jgi:RNA polymerase sigma factor (TIGR02999 family)